MPRFNPKALESIYFIPTIASGTLAPTVAEVTAGTVLHTVIRTVNGFKFQGSTMGAEDVGSRFPKTVGGNDQVDACGFEIYTGDKSDDPEVAVKTALARDTVGYIMFVKPVNGARVTIAAGSKGQIWPVAVITNAENHFPDGPATTTISFSTPSEPKDVTVLA